jgi:hypothetical protein
MFIGSPMSPARLLMVSVLRGWMGFIGGGNKNPVVRGLARGFVTVTGTRKLKEHGGVAVFFWPGDLAEAGVDEALEVRRSWLAI